MGCNFKEMPKSILSLSKLKRLQLSYNANLSSLNGISKLKNLEELAIFRCDFKCIPKEFLVLKILKKLYIGDNNNNNNIKKDKTFKEIKKNIDLNF
jgi:hypothetical protein